MCSCQKLTGDRPNLPHVDKTKEFDIKNTNTKNKAVEYAK